MKQYFKRTIIFKILKSLNASSMKLVGLFAVLFYTASLAFLSSCQLVDNRIRGHYGDSPSTSQTSLSIETQSDGSGSEVTSQSLTVGQTLNIYAIERNNSGSFVANVEVSWVLNGGVGNLNILSSGKEAQYQASTQGSAEVKATYNGVTKTINITINPLVSSFNHGGWSDVVALGPKTNSDDLYIQPDATGTTSLNIADSDMKITLSWNDFPNDTEDGYEVYRSTTSGGQDFFSPLTTILGAGTKTYTDTNITPGTVYYYVVRPTKSGTAYSTSESYSEIRITAPPENMGLVHRWIANQEVCGLMSKATDPINNYRCAFTGQGNSGGFYDLGHDLLVDRFESGCNYTKSSCSGGSLGGGPADCTAADAPGGTITGSLGDVYYENDNATCYVNTDGGTTWQSANGASNLNLASMISSKAHLPPLVRIDQTESYAACEQMQISIDDGGAITTPSKRLLRQKEWRAAAAWSPLLNDTDISNIEADGDTDGYCNTDFAGSGSRDHTENIGIAYSMLHTGSQATSDMGAGNKCVSRYGLQDMVGNTWEWASDQCDFTGTSCANPGTPLDPGNLDIGGWTIPTGFGVLLSTLTEFSPALGIPLNAPEDGSIDAATFGTKYHGDYFYDTFGQTGLRGLLVGGNWFYGGVNGRWTSRWSNSPSITSISYSPRCSAPLP